MLSHTYPCPCQIYLRAPSRDRPWFLDVIIEKTLCFLFFFPSPVLNNSEIILWCGGWDPHLILPAKIWSRYAFRVLETLRATLYPSQDDFQTLGTQTTSGSNPINSADAPTQLCLFEVLKNDDQRDSNLNLPVKIRAFFLKQKK